MCLLSSPPNGYFKMPSMAHYTNKNTVRFEIQILAKIRQSEIISTILKSGIEIIASKCLERQKKLMAV